jgi:hypothetical protein
MNESGIIASVLTVIGTLALCGVIAWVSISRARRDGYEGVIVEKAIVPPEDDMPTVYRLVLPLKNGQGKTVSVDQKQWDSLSVGDKVMKRTGQLNLERA